VYSFQGVNNPYIRPVWETADWLNPMGVRKGPSLIDKVEQSGSVRLWELPGSGQTTGARGGEGRRWRTVATASEQHASGLSKGLESLWIPHQTAAGAGVPIPKAAAGRRTAQVGSLQRPTGSGSQSGACSIGCSRSRAVSV